MLLSALGVIAIAGFAFTRLSFNVDPLDLLPGDLHEVKGLRLFSERFAGEGELILTLALEEAEEGQLESLSASLVAHLREGEGLVDTLRWKPLWEEDPLGAASLPAYLWLNGDPDGLRDLAASLAPGQSEATIAEAFEELTFGIDAQSIAWRAYDPLGLLRPSGAAVAGAEAGGGSGGKFASVDGGFRAIYLTAPGRPLNYSESAEWIEAIKREVGIWRAEAGVPAELEVGYTGEPAFEAEIGGGMQRDMSGSISAALLLIHLLFFAMHRRLLPLGAMFMALALILSLTVIVGSFVFGKLSVMSVGFAAILVGLAVDYGVVLYQEARLGQAGFAGLRKTVAPAILWAAITTAAVFASLGLSSLPGIRELGLLVALGILFGATVMLWLFGPLAASLATSNPMPPRSAPEGPGRERLAGMLTAGLLLVAGVMIAVRGAPDLYTGFDMLRPKDSPADDAFSELMDRLAGSGKGDSVSFSLVIEAGDLEALETKSGEVAVRLERLHTSGEIRSSTFVPEMIPSARRQEANRAALTELLEQSGRLKTELGRDFRPEALGLVDTVFGAWREMLGSGELPALPPGAGRSALAQVVDLRDGSVAALGLVRAEYKQLAGLRSEFADLDGVYLTGWETLGPAVRPLVIRDLRAVFIPMAFVLLIMLAIVFRNARDVLLAIATLATSAFLLLALMRVAGWSWDFLNISAFPLLLGTGIDYTVHMIGALRRHDGARLPVRRGIGRALTFCGLSTAIGFGSLAMANNAGLASLGRVCAAGILITMAVAVFLLPCWWRLANRVRLTGGGATPS